jgi:hypothetical protein
MRPKWKNEGAKCELLLRRAFRRIFGIEKITGGGGSIVPDFLRS